MGLTRKEKRFILTFYTTAEAMATEKLARKNGIEGKLISAPRNITADCGIAFASPLYEADRIRLAVMEEGIEVQGYFEQ